MTAVMPRPKRMDGEFFWSFRLERPARLDTEFGMRFMLFS